ncbi:MAG: hypothetical protein J5659_00580 [Clostridia bacterium]|nr:hypothetical protein [Clostridia bacterium]
MTKNVFSKAIASVLVVAICMVAVFACAVSATTERTAVCAVTGAAYDVGAKDSYVTAEVNFASEVPFTAGSFVVSAADLTLNECSVAQSEGGTAPEVYINVSNKKILFAGFQENAENDFKSYTSLTLILKFTVSNYQSVEKAPAGCQWAVNVTDIDITNTAEETYATDDASGSIHVHNFGAGSGTNIQTSTCSICGATHVEVADTTGIGTNTLADTKKANITFSKTGDTVLNALVAKGTIDAGGYDNVYFVYEYKGDDADPVKATTTYKADDTVTLGGTVYYRFPLYGDAGVGRISREYTGNFVTVKSGTVTVSSDTWNYSIMKYAADIINGDFSADIKNYSEALLDYGYYTAEKLGFSTAAYATCGATVPTGVTNADLPSSKKATTNSGTDNNWGIGGISVTTGFKPKMNIRFDQATLNNKSSVTIKVTVDSKLKYYKEVAVSALVVNPKGAVGAIAEDTYILSDIPTKYLTGDIAICAKSGANDSAKIVYYSYGRYAKAKQGTGEGNVFQALVNWSHYLNVAYPG